MPAIMPQTIELTDMIRRPWEMEMYAAWLERPQARNS
jgi:hypothetical protein